MVEREFQDSDEEVHYCKKCSKVLEEGRAYELGGNRWHVECFTCSSCNTLLDCDTNLLVLGNGSLICNNCSYRCQTCHKKIEDLAILTGDQAYCSSCFCCRNCKKKIEDLRYARTFQGIFCMACHETLLARKKRSQEKRSQQNQQQHRHTLHQRETSTSGHSSHRRPNISNHSSGSSVNNNKAGSPASLQGKNLREKSLPSIPTDGKLSEDFSPQPNRQSFVAAQSNSSKTSTPINLMDGNGMVSKRQTRNNGINHGYSNSSGTVTLTENYHQRNESESSNLGFLPIKLDESLTLDAQRQASPPPITAPTLQSTSPPPAIPAQPQSLLHGQNQAKAHARPDESSGSYFENANVAGPQSSNLNVPFSNNRPASVVSTRSYRSFHVDERAKPSAPDVNENDKDIDSESFHSVLSVVSPEDQPSGKASQYSGLSNTTSATATNKPMSPPPPFERPRTSLDGPRESKRLESDFLERLIPERSLLRSTSPMRSTSPARSQSPLRQAMKPHGTRTPPRYSAMSVEGVQISSRVARSPRASPVVSPRVLSPDSPRAEKERTAIDDRKQDDDNQMSSIISLPSFNSTSQLLLAESLTPFLSSERENDKDQAEVAQLSSNSSKASPISQESEDVLEDELIQSKRRIADLERQLSQKPDKLVSDLEQDLEKKRRTIAGLQAAQLVSSKELEVLQAESDRVVDDEMMRSFKLELQQYKEQVMREITELLQKRDELRSEVNDLTNKRDQLASDSSVLNLKNTQLADMNNELTKRMIDKFGVSNPAQGLVSKLPTSSSTVTLDSYANSPSHLSSSQSGIINGSHSFGEDPLVTVLEAGQVIDTRKDRQHARRFWKRPGAAMAKGLNKVFANEESPSAQFLQQQNGQLSQPQPNSTMNSVTDLSQENGLGISFPQKQQKPRNGWFNKASDSHANMTSNSGTGKEEPRADALMGAPIEQRVLFENAKIPILVTRCIEEVESRGLDFEGVYRKSGGKSQITQIEEVFENCQQESYDEVLSGDISGVTSALKQYLRYLPIPLITFDVYESFIQCSENPKPDLSIRIEKMRQVVERLPAAHRDTLEILMRHLNKVTQYSEVNLMTTKNLAVVFAPTVAWHTTGEREIKDMQPRNDGTQLLIESYDAIFQSTNDAFF